MTTPMSIGDEIGVASAAAHNRPEDARTYIQRFYEELGEAKFLLLHEIFRQMFPQYDNPKEPKDE